MEAEVPKYGRKGIGVTINDTYTSIVLTILSHKDHPQISEDPPPFLVTSVFLEKFVLKL